MSKPYLHIFNRRLYNLKFQSTRALTQIQNDQNFLFKLLNTLVNKKIPEKRYQKYIYIHMNQLICEWFGYWIPRHCLSLKGNLTDTNSALNSIS
jgi:hypothetical protein